MKWQYLVETMVLEPIEGDAGRYIQDMMNDFGKEGWELVTLTVVPCIANLTGVSKFSEYTLYMKRPA